MPNLRLTSALFCELYQKLGWAASGRKQPGTSSPLLNFPLTVSMQSHPGTFRSGMTTTLSHLSTRQKDWESIIKDSRKKSHSKSIPSNRSICSYRLRESTQTWLLTPGRGKNLDCLSQDVWKLILTRELIGTSWSRRAPRGVGVADAVRRLGEHVAGWWWKRGAWRMLERLGICGIVRHQRLAVQRSVSELGEEAEVRVELAVSWNKYRR